MSELSVCLLGFGEVGQALCDDLRTRVGRVTAWDLDFADAASGPSRAAAQREGLAMPDAKQAVDGADLVISAVTAAQTGEAASSVAPYLKREAYFFDLNSTSPAAKCRAAGIVDSAGARFVEAAIMSPISPRRAAAPMLLGGAHAAAFLPLARELGFSGARNFSEKLGAASAAKMCRSVIVKGLEALMLESLLTARQHEVDDAVIDSLNSLFPADDWRNTARYMISRALVHGRRRAEEMREAARTVSEVGLTSRMSSACADWEDWASRHHAAAAQQDIGSMLDALLAAQRLGSAPC
jgi:3-hydroxyisobutyrate dehydrogenase-like beta-hydroxyacid dehydrogenase